MKWKELLNQQVNSLIAEKKLFVGRITDFDERTGYFKFRLRKDLVPRQHSEYFFGLIGPKVISYGDIYDWSFSYREFRKSEPDALWLDRIGGDANSINCYRVDDDWAYFNFQIPDKSVSNDLKQVLQDNGDAIAIVTESDPPIKYLENLCEFVTHNPGNVICNSRVEYDIKAWKPRLVDNSESIASEVGDWSSVHDLIIVQGPPGTGKSYNAAEYCNDLLQSDKTVCICSLANKALVEIASQPGLEQSLKEKRVYKTNVSDNEKFKIPNLQYFDEQIPPPGTLLLSTYYKFSEIARNLLQENLRFDVVIIEEASQAFLATIAMFRAVAKKVILIGDHMQLPPVVITNKNRLLKIHDHIFGAINGMATVANTYEKQSYRLTKTRRLTVTAASLTGNFYDGTLDSISPLNNTMLHSSVLTAQAFGNIGGATILQLPVADPNYGIAYVKRLIRSLVNDITNSGDYSVAILVPTVNLEIELTQSLVKTVRGNQNITVSTVHKVQGITVDYAIVYLPLKNSMIELGENFFNVATSRAKRGSLIITNDALGLQAGIELSVRTFLEVSLKVKKEEILI
ncbi:MAG: AAA domain-containing protein [Crocinitomicaceae bacterium]|nr:AAA domain-containing protein [Crocinitomicaceae bacterium]